MTSQIIHFNEGDVKVEQMNGQYSAYEVGCWLIVERGSTMLEAIANLNEKLKEEK